MNCPGPGGNLLAGNLPVGSLELAAVGNLELEEVGRHHKAGRMLAVVHSQRVEGQADRCVTSAALEALAWAVAQTCHPSCPFQPCAVSACRRKPSSTPYQTGRKGSGKPLKVPHYRQ